MITDPAIEAYCTEHTTAETAHLSFVAAETRRLSQASGMMVGPLEGAFLAALVAAVGARAVLEIGTFTGYSALWMATALPDGGRIVTCEVDGTHAAIAREAFASSPHADLIDLRFGPAIDTIASLGGPFDLVFVDADKSSYDAYFEAVLPKLAPSGLIVLDNVLWRGQVLAESSDDADTAALIALNDKLSRDDRVRAVMLPLRDGITLVRRA